MRRCALIWLAASGCFYTETINQRPSLDIRQTSTATVFRGDSVRLEAIANDPDGHFVTYKWRAYLCPSEGDCDKAPYFGGFEDYFTFSVPSSRNDIAAPVEAVHVWLEGMDDFGATAKPAQQLWIPVADRAPTLELRKDSRYGYVVATPINVFAKVGDPDDWPAVPELAWEVFTPTNQPAYELVDITVPPDDDDQHLQVGKKFTPQGMGDYELRVTATDALGAKTTKSVMITVGPDAPPCLRTLSPIVAPTGNALPMSEPTLFQVHVVADDLDPYPTVNDAQLGTTTFSWSLKTNSGTRQALTGVSSSSVALDPASYQPGDIVEVRVEIADRNNTAITCSDANQTCSAISDNTCIQRQTWRVEVR